MKSRPLRDSSSAHRTDFVNGSQRPPGQRKGDFGGFASVTSIGSECEGRWGLLLQCNRSHQEKGRPSAPCVCLYPVAWGYWRFLLATDLALVLRLAAGLAGALLAVLRSTGRALIFRRVLHSLVGDSMRSMRSLMSLADGPQLVEGLGHPFLKDVFQFVPAAGGFGGNVGCHG